MLVWLSRERQKARFGRISASAMMTNPKCFARFAAKGFRGVGNRKSFNTTNLRRHLQHHPEENKKLVVAENAEKERQQARYLAHSSMASTCQTTVAQCFERQKSSCYSSYIGRLGACILLCWECCHSNPLLP